MSTLKIIVPVTITEAMVDSTNIAEDDYDVYDAGTTYAIGGRCILAHRIYESLQDANTGNNPPDNLTGDDPAWKDAGATTAYKMFDLKTRSASTNAETIAVTITPGVLCNSLALLDLEGTTVTVTETHPTNGVVYSNELSLVDLSEKTTLYNWFFLPPVRKPTVVLLDLTAYTNTSITIVVSNPGGIAQIGELVVGRQKALGTLKYDYSGSLDDYSTKTKDDDGNTTLVEGEYSEPLDFSIRATRSQLYDIKRTIAELRATPLVVIGDEDALESITYGYVDSFSWTVPNNRHANITLSIEELN